MPKILAATILALTLTPSLSRADSWTDGQDQWAKHGFKHGAWDCYGKCPDGRRPQARSAPTRLSLACQRNLDDGRTLISDGRALPPNARTKIVSYRPARQADGWSYGTCVVDVIR